MIGNKSKNKKLIYVVTAVFVTLGILWWLGLIRPVKVIGKVYPTSFIKELHFYYKEPTCNIYIIDEKTIYLETIEKAGWVHYWKYYINATVRLWSNEDITVCKFGFCTLYNPVTEEKIYLIFGRYSGKCPQIFEERNGKLYAYNILIYDGILL